jgi:hypothetical protein
MLRKKEQKIQKLISIFQKIRRREALVEKLRGEKVQ